ncbi:uncharacterized protein [Cherax quadricarinatus]
MEFSRSTQDKVALRDVAYVIRFGHFPSEEDDAGGSFITSHRHQFMSTPQQTADISPSPELSIASDEQILFNDEQNFFNEVQNRFADDRNPFVDALNPFAEDGSLAVEDQSPNISQNSCSSSSISRPNDDSSVPSSPVGDQCPTTERRQSELSSYKDRFTTPLPTSVSPSLSAPQTQVSPSLSTPQTPVSPSLPTPPADISTFLPIPETEVSPNLPTAPARVSKTLEINNVSRAHVKELITQAFNVTRLDLCRMVEDIGNSKVAPAVELLLEEIRTEGLALEPTTGSPSPPVVFIRAVLSGKNCFSSFTSTSATKVTNNTITLTVKNMYTDTLLLEVWKAGRSSPVEDAQNTAVIDILGRLINTSIRYRKDKANVATCSRSSEEAASTTETNQTSPSSDAGAGAALESSEERDEVDHSDETPIINVSLWEDRNQRDRSRSLNDSHKITKKTSPKIVEVKEKKTVITNGVARHNESCSNVAPDDNSENGLSNGNDVDSGRNASDTTDMSDSISVSSELCLDHMRTSTHRDRSASVQNLDLSPSTNKVQEKGNIRKGSLRISASNLRASVRSSFKKFNHNKSPDSKNLQHKSADTCSLRSETDSVSTSPNPFNEEADIDTSNPHAHAQESPTAEKSKLEKKLSYDTSKQNGNNNLDRERSRSTISITSFSKINLGIRRSSQKATEIFKRIGSKKDKKSSSETSSPDLRRQNLTNDNTSISSFQIESSREGEDNEDSLADTHSTHDALETHTNGTALSDTPVLSSYLRKSFRTKFSTPRTLRAFRNLKDKGNTKKQLESKTSGEGHTDEQCVDGETNSRHQNPPEIQSYLSSIGKGHLKAELVAHVSVPLKTLIGTWKREGWLPLSLTNVKDDISTQKKKKFNRAGGNVAVKKTSNKSSVSCKLHICLTLPTPESELTTTGYDTYSSTLRSLIDMQVQALDTVRDYKGSVGVVGEVLLQQLVFFSRVSDPHKTLAKWLVLVEVKPSDPELLLPLLKAIRTHLEAGLYLTTQKRQLAGSLSRWVRNILTNEFEMLHSSFPSSSDLLELPRLENFLRCFNTVENCYELRVLFEREVSTQGMTSVTDQLQGALSKHVETWVEALNKEKLQRESDTSAASSTISASFRSWQEAQRRASLLTKPILNFLTISLCTYQPIFMIELAVDYLYLVMPKMLTAALHLLNPVTSVDVDALAQVPSEVMPSAAQAAWVLCTNLSQINKIGIESGLPQHLIPQEYREAFSTILLHWLVLSKHLALEECQRDIQQDEFVAVDDMAGYSQSAVGVADLLKALMIHVCEVKWPGDVGPSGGTLIKISQHIMELAAQYITRITQSYTVQAGDKDTILKEVCVVVRNVEHVCNEVRKHLLHLSKLASTQKEMEAAQELEERTKHLQQHIDNAAEVLLLRCLPHLENLLTQGVSQGSSEYIVERLELAMQPVEDRLYFAEPLLQQLWLRLFQHATLLMNIFIQGSRREELRRLRSVLADTHTFLTNQDGVGLQLPAEVNKEYESLQEELKILGATSPELVSQFYHERYQEQLKEGPSASRTLVLNAAFTETGLRVHVVQGPGEQAGGVLVKIRVEPQEWFPLADPCKTHLAKGDPAVFNEIFRFPSVLQDHLGGEQGGVLTLQLRTPRLLGSSVVHCEAVFPLSELPRIPEASVLSIQHLRVPLTRPWKLTSYKPLEALKSRALDKIAVDFLKVLSERWEPRDSSIQIQDSQKLRATFARASSVRNSMKGGRKMLTYKYVAENKLSLP